MDYLKKKIIQRKEEKKLPINIKKERKVEKIVLTTRRQKRNNHQKSPK